MKVIFFHPRYHPLFSGHAMNLDRIRRRLARADLDMEVWTPRLDESPAFEVREGVPVRRFGPVGEDRLHSWMRTLHLMGALLWHRGRYDILHHGGTEPRLRWLILAAALAGRKQILQMTLLGGDDPLTLMADWPQALMPWMYGLVDRWTALGKVLREAYERSSLPPEKLVMLPNTVDPDEFHPALDKPALRKQLNLPPDRPIVLSVGHICHRKGYDLLVEAALKVKAQVPDALFLFVGPIEVGDERVNAASRAFVAELQARIETLGLQDTVRILGPQPDAPRFFQAADIYVLASRAEGLPNVVVEAMACDLPVVMSELEGTARDLLVDGETGFVFPQEDVETLSRNLITLLQDPELQKTFAARSRARVLPRFSFDQVVERYYQLYVELMGSAKEASAPA